MNEPFDYTELFKGAFAAMREEQPGNRIAPAAAYLRTRIEAAFVPLHRYETVYAVAAEQGLASVQATARAEAAEAENVRLRGFVEHYARQPCSCGIMQGAVICGPCNARQTLGAEHGK